MALEAGLYLIPTQLSYVPLERVLPAHNIDVVREIRHYVVESLRSARRFLKKCDRDIDIDSLTFNELNEHTNLKDTTAIEAMLDPIGRGEAVGVISDAGCPAVADPGADLVAIAQRKGYKVFPLVGPSSILMSLMASGFNGQSFAFLGYLPVESAARQARLKEMTRRIERERQTQIFIEAPYRNNQLIADLAAHLPSGMRLCVASDITGEGQSIITRTIAQWKQAKYDYHKVPTIFLLFQ
jgi:16S rRNA (cytidine1402-2'-O)-methyltransferase